ncbi:hypothetical protein AGMMS50225_22130 [Betaproteobacteria bacterium]|nr:hypothetical protein AGMMS50225_22130 [Betaproteobacteria bacterium]
MADDYFTSIPYQEVHGMERYNAGMAAGMASVESSYSEGYDDGYHAAAAKANPIINKWADATVGWKNYSDKLQAEIAQLKAQVSKAHDEGFKAGHMKGWNDSTAKSNPVVERCNAKIAAQQEQINAQQAKINKLEAEMDTRAERFREILGTQVINAKLSAEKATAELVESLKAENVKLHEDVVALEDRLREHGTAFSSFPQHFPAVDVLVDTLGDVLGELNQEAEADTPVSEALGSRFAEAYARNVKEGIEAGRLKLAPHEDPIFAKHSPAAFTHLVKLINNAEASEDVQKDRESWSDEFSLDSLMTP